PPTLTPTGSAAATTGTTLTAVTIPGGTSQTFTWNYTENGTGVGTLELSAGVTGQDANSGAPLHVSTVTSNTMSLPTPGGPLITSFALPTTLSRGQTFTLSMTVQNTGGSSVNAVAPLPMPPTLNATGGANATTSSSPLAADLGPGASHTYTWTYTEN